MIKSKKFKVPIYNVSFTVVIFERDEELQNKFKKVEFEPNISEFDGGVFEWKNHFYLCLRKQFDKVQYPTNGIIAHEAKHLVNNIFIYISHKLDEYNDEPECYLLGWIVDKIHTVL